MGISECVDELVWCQLSGMITVKYDVGEVWRSEKFHGSSLV